MSQTQVENVLASKMHYEWGQTIQGILTFAEDLLDHVRDRINGWPRIMHEDEFGHCEEVDDSCADLGRRCLEALGQVARIGGEVDDVQQAPDRELVESVTNVLLDVFRKCRDFMADGLRQYFANVHHPSFYTSSPGDEYECACKELGQMATLVNALEDIRSVMAGSNAD